MTFADEHDFVNYPELTNSELSTFGFVSPHVQIEEDFEAVVVEVHDGDTVTLRTDFRSFDFPLRFSLVDAPELNTGVPGKEARDFVKALCEGETAQVKINRDNRVDKYGRLLGDLTVAGLSVSELLIIYGYAWPFSRRLEGEIPDLNKTLSEKQWF